MENQPRNEKEEKALEKREEKSFDEKWRQDPLSAIVWALILIWAGTVFLASNFNYLDSLPIEVGTWSLIFLGAGLIVLFEVLVRLIVPAYRRSILGSFIFAIVLIGIGLADFVDFFTIGAIVLILIGVSILVRGIFGGR